MKIAHIADLHLGRTLYGQSLLSEQKMVLSDILKSIIEQNAELVIIAGDIFDKKQPSQKAMNLYNDWLTKVLNHCPVITIAGNHDNAALIDYGASLFQKNQYYTIGTQGTNIKKVTLKDEYGPLNIYLLPYYHPYDLKALFKNHNIDFLDETEAFKFLLQQQSIDFNQRNIIVMHAFITGRDGINPQTSESESHSVGFKEEMPYTLIEYFDYVALGHLHRNQKIGKDHICYAGSIYPYSFSEGNQKYFNLINIREKNNLNIDKININLNRKVIEKRGTYDALQKEAKNHPSDDYISLKFTDYSPYLDIEEWKENYPNLLHVEQEPIFNNEIQNKQNIDVDHMKPIEIFEEYYLEKTNNHLNDQQKDIVQKIFKEIGEEF